MVCHLLFLQEKMLNYVIPTYAFSTSEKLFD